MVELEMEGKVNRPGFAGGLAIGARELSDQEISLVAGGDGIVIYIGDDGTSTFTMNGDGQSGQWDEADC